MDDETLGTGGRLPSLAGGAVWLVVGAQGAGKSTTAQLLAARFDRSVHVRGDQFRRWAVNGWAQPGASGPEGESRRLLDLRYRLSGLVADEYATAGFTVVAQDTIFADDVTAWLRRVEARPRHLVVLRRSVEVVVRRDAERRARTGKVAYGPDGVSAADLDDTIARVAPVGLWLDTSAMTPVEVVDTIVARAEEARVDDI